MAGRSPERTRRRRVGEKAWVEERGEEAAAAVERWRRLRRREAERRAIFFAGLGFDEREFGGE